MAHALLRAPSAESVDLCLFDSVASRSESRRIPLAKASDGLWELATPLAAGQLYGYRVGGPWEPRKGLRFNPSKVLLDPWALEVGRLPRWNDSLVAVTASGAADPRDSAPFAPLGRLIDLDFLEELEMAPRPLIPAGRELVYEAHVKGLTALHPAVPPHLRGTFAGASHPAVLDHLVRMGVTTVELLPVMQHVDDRFLVERGLTNYWGYSTLAYFAPHAAWSHDRSRPWREFRRMVSRFHDAGIEVLLDVVYNHTCEGPFDGPQLGFRGFGPDWYRRRPRHPEIQEDYTGCGNSLDFRRASVVRFCLDSLRTWAEFGGVDGFRYDLASVHGRLEAGFDPAAPFFQALGEDRTLSGLKHVAEPWDATWDGYAVGKFPDPWRDWNDRFRDDVRRFWRDGGPHAQEYALRMTGSRDLFPHRSPAAPVNFVTCHDGSTLHDILSWAHKTNEANGEDNRDGADHEIRSVIGPQGICLDPEVASRRGRRARNLLASVLLAPGTPMILGGDEFARTQRGNNNAYCQDNEISWMHWGEPPPHWPGPSWIGFVATLRHQYLSEARWERIETGDGYILLSWSTWKDRGRLVAQSGGKLRSIHLDGRFERLLDTSCEEESPVAQLPAGSFLLDSDALILLRCLD